MAEKKARKTLLQTDGGTLQQASEGKEENQRTNKVLGKKGEK